MPGSLRRQADTIWQVTQGNPDDWRDVVLPVSDDGPLGQVRSFVANEQVAAGECIVSDDGEPGVVIVGRNESGESVGMLISMPLAEELSQHLRDLVNAHLRRKLHG